MSQILDNSNDFYLVVKGLMITKNSVMKIQNLIMNLESHPLSRTLCLLTLKGTLTDIKKWCFGKYCSCDKACQFSAL